MKLALALTATTLGYALALAGLYLLCGLAVALLAAGVALAAIGLLAVDLPAAD